jgi:hypothetical protein
MIHKGAQRVTKDTKGTKDHIVPQSYSIPKPYPLFQGGSHTSCNRKLGYYDSCTLYRDSALYPRVVISSLAKRLEKPPFCHSYTSFGVWPRDHYMPLTKAYYRSISCFATDSPAKGPACSAKDFPAKGPFCTMWFRQITKYVTCMTQRMMHMPNHPSKTHNL